MKKITIGGLAALALAVLATGPVAAEERSFIARLLPVNDILPPESPARGTAIFRLSADGALLEFEVTAFGIAGVTQIHIHIGEAATTIDGKHFHRSPEENDGPITVFLLDCVCDGIAADGTLAKGEITAADLRGPFKGQSMRTFIAHIDQGATYVNVHVTKDLGPGCCPVGLRGTITATSGPQAALDPGSARALVPAAPPRHPS